MKSQRSFVVERKSSRRQPKTQASSIWGDTDFKTLAREIEVEAPDMFEVSQDPAEQPAAAPTVVEEIVEAPAPAADNAHMPVVVPTDQRAEAVAPVPTVRARRIARKRGIARQPVWSSWKAPAQHPEKPSAAAVMTYDALMELEELNRRLAAQLREQFEAEHAQLVRMLEQVDFRTTI